MAKGSDKKTKQVKKQRKQKLSKGGAKSKAKKTGK